MRAPPNLSLFPTLPPDRRASSYVIKQPSYFSIFWALVKPFLKPKLTKRLHLLGDDLPALHKLVDPAGLPADFGGALPADLSSFLDELERREAGGIGGFVFPMSAADPCGLRRTATSAASAAASSSASSAAAASSSSAAAAAGNAGTAGK